ncbi:hypothetical protein [Desertivibrio insolitus]|uniref:hypothetical protein n=1 Tax=Herbiconiux sp. SYSU D00978 TaxID=2812562 RepID=UPI001A9595D3|nr:hypothetical protein [Herbiconiux sp. SYSU D00978]
MSEHEHPSERVSSARPNSDLEDAVRSIEATGEDEWPRGATDSGEEPDKAPNLADDSDSDEEEPRQPS